MISASAAFTLYRRAPVHVLGFHGCDRDIGEAVLAGKHHLRHSQNLYDWLGDGIYFWEASPMRALQFATEAMANPKLTSGRIKRPFVVGALIDLGECCNLFDIAALDELGQAHEVLCATHEANSMPLPQNKGPERALRFLDRAAVQTMHRVREELGLPRYETVRGGFSEGGLLYPEAGFSKRSHIQIAVREPKCIKAYFRPIPEEGLRAPGHAKAAGMAVARTATRKRARSAGR